jgi:hypothetical protein
MKTLAYMAIAAAAKIAAKRYLFGIVLTFVRSARSRQTHVTISAGC